MAIQQILESVSAAQLKTNVPVMDVGDTINVHCRIVEGDKERIQVFQGVLMVRKGRGSGEMITVRRIVNDEGVERTFPLHSPKIDKLEVAQIGDVNRAKLYYLRGRVGKRARVRELRQN